MKKFKVLLSMLLLFLGTSVLAVAKTYKLKMGIVAGVNSNEYKAVKFFADKVQEDSKGKVKIKLYPDSQLGDDRSMLEQLSGGALDLTLAETARFQIFFPEVEIYSLPYVIEDFAHAKKALYNTNFGQNLMLKINNELGIKFLAQAYNGVRETTSNKAINSVEDMKGLKLRVPNAKSNLNYAKYSGAAPTPMSFTEVYLALQTNSVDGQENPLSAIKAQKFYEVQPYLALTNHILNDQIYLISEASLKKLPKEYQEIVLKSAEAAAEYHTELFVKEEKELLDFFKGKGIVVTTPNLKEFRVKMQPIYDEYIVENGEIGKKALEEIKAVAK